jgi:hypothetical protein
MIKSRLLSLFLLRIFTNQARLTSNEINAMSNPVNRSRESYTHEKVAGYFDLRGVISFQCTPWWSPLSEEYKPHAAKDQYRKADTNCQECDKY